MKYIKLFEDKNDFDKLEKEIKLLFYILEDEGVEPIVSLHLTNRIEIKLSSTHDVSGTNITNRIEAVREFLDRCESLCKEYKCNFYTTSKDKSMLIRIY